MSKRSSTPRLRMAPIVKNLPPKIGIVSARNATKAIALSVVIGIATDMAPEIETESESDAIAAEIVEETKMETRT